jgi:pentatricopeptide repeat protein
MILGYANCGQGEKALQLFQQMQQEGVQPNPVTFLGVLNACTVTVALEEGRRAHEQIFKAGVIRMYLLGIALLTCMQNVGA